MKITEIQSLAKFLGWDIEKAKKVKQTDTEIAPNGTRRERRINAEFKPSGEEGSCEFYLSRNLNMNKRLKEINKKNMGLNTIKEQKSK